MSDGELSAFADLATMFGVNEELFSQLVAFDPRSTTLQECLQGLGNDALARRMIYDAIKISSVDGYAAKEREAVSRAAQIMGIDATTVAQHEGLVQAERGLVGPPRRAARREVETSRIERRSGGPGIAARRA